MNDFSGKTIIVTGGAQGIGRGIAEYLLDRKCQVVMSDIDIEAGQELVEHLARPEGLLFVHTDVSKEQQVMQCIAETLQFSGRIDGLVNNAGIADPNNAPVTELLLDDWEKILRTNLTGSFLMVKHAAPYLSAQQGAVVNIASTRAIQSEANTEAYAASKGGLVALTHAMAISFGSRIRVNAILPGWIDVSKLKKKSAGKQVHFSRRDHEQHPVGRIGTVKDIAALTAFLLSGQAGFITGQQFIVDGGMTRKMIYGE
jgi:NAD(P)-dependent dehydrogenase (short-subunit alcohol dehydrogenase family)